MATGEITAHATWLEPPRRPELTPQQRDLVLDAAAELTSAAVIGRSPTLPDTTLGGAAEVTLSGAFVSLKRGKHLRSCCGMLGTPIALGRAIADAAYRTAREDVRFPPVSPIELERLELEVWLLYAPEPMRATGADRVGAVTVGKHGLQVVRGESRGLLLPGVPVENNWDAERFLEQVCVKAGLHQTAWKDDATALFTFEGDSLRAPLATRNGGVQVTHRPAPFTPDEIAAYADFCRANIIALLTGATPSYYFMGAPDGNVSGLVISVTRPGSSDNLTFSQMSLRPGVPLQSTLFSLSQMAAQGLARQGIRANELGEIQVGLAVMHDPAMHGTAADADLFGIDSRRRALIVIERNKSGLVYDHRRSADDLLRSAVEEAQVSNPAGAGVFSLAALSTLDRLTVSTAPRPVRGPAVRPAGVAGMFYPDDPAELSRLVDQMLGGDARPDSWPAAMVPHAGLIYSGRIAGSVFQRIRIPRTVIIIGPKHTPLGMEWAVAPHQTWSLPGGTLESDPKLARQLADAIPGLELDAAAHQREHGIEVELPLLQRLAPESKVVGIAIGGGDLDRCRLFARGLADLLRERDDRPLLVISSDMNHFATDSENRRLDELALAALDTLDPEKVYETVTSHRISMCGVLPAVIVLETLRLLGGLSKSERVGYATTADVTGDASRVVGYAGMLFG